MSTPEADSSAFWVKLERRQFGLTIFEAIDVSRNLANAATKFREATGAYESQTLPELVAAYTKIRDHSGAKFDPNEAAKAELAWWVARRTPGRDSPEQVGAEIAKLYAILYGSGKEEFRRAGLLRAQAAHLRDQNGGEWDKVESLLRESYEILKSGI